MLAIRIPVNGFAKIKYKPEIKSLRFGNVKAIMEGN